MCRGERIFAHMRTNVELDDKLVEDLLAKTGIKTKRELIDTALRDLQRRLGIREIKSLRGIVADGGWDPEYDIAEGRRS